MAAQPVDHHQDVVGDEALDHLDDALVLRDAHVVAADDGGHAADAAGDDGVVERPERAAVEAALHVVDVLVGEAGDEGLVVVGDVDGAAVGVVVDRHAHDLAGGLRARCSSNSMCVAPGILALGDVVMSFVWKRWASGPRACMMHCTSTTIASTAPVSMASSWCRKLPAAGMPWRIRISLLVQQMPARLMPLAPAALASAISSGSRDGLDDHLRERRLVAVDDDVDLVVLEHAEVDLAGEAATACRRGCR